MDKAQLLERVIVSLLEQAERSAGSAAAARQASIEAPGAMQSHSDTTKTQQGWLSQSLARASAEIREGVRRLREVDTSHMGKIHTGALVTLRKEERGDPEIYFILPAGSGMTFLSDKSQSIVVTTPESPVGKAIMGKSVGDRCEIRAPGGARVLIVESVE